MELSRREVMKTSVAAALLSGVPAGWRGSAFASDAPETPKVRVGIIALTDCSSIVMAHELGLFKKHGIDSTISKEASWAVIRDRLTLGENQASHLLLGMAYASTMGLLGSPVKPMVIPCYLNRNGQAITLKKAFLAQGVKTPETLKPQVEAAKQAATPLTFAMTFPPGTHAMWMRYWLASGGIHPAFSLLDALTRMELQDELMRLWEEDRKTVVMVTHDVDEALLLADRVVMMTSGPAATIGEILSVPFPRPRRREEIVATSEYFEVRDAVVGFLEERAHAQS